MTKDIIKRLQESKNNVMTKTNKKTKMKKRQPKVVKTKNKGNMMGKMTLKRIDMAAAEI